MKTLRYLAAQQENRDVDFDDETESSCEDTSPQRSKTKRKRFLKGMVGESASCLSLESHKVWGQDGYRNAETYRDKHEVTRLLKL